MVNSELFLFIGDVESQTKMSRFALKELRLILVTLLRKFDLSIVEGQNYELRVHTVPYLKQGKYLVSVKKRV